MGFKEAVASKFDIDGDGKVSFEEVLKTLQGELKLFVIDSPFILGTMGVCIVVQVVTDRIYAEFTQQYFALWPWAYTSFLNPMTYVRIFTQVIGHGGWDHLVGNLTTLILVGPPCEEHFGTWKLFLCVVIMAIATSFFHYLFAPAHAMQLGASGMVFELIVLHSLIHHRSGKIRASFVVLLLLWVWKEVQGFAHNLHAAGGGDGISHVAHFFGAAVGAFMGLLFTDTSFRQAVLGSGARLVSTVTGRKSQ